MFAKEYKQDIPRFVTRLGVVTAPTGAAIQDIINVSKRRNPYIEIVLYPALVQGDGAPDSIVRGIHALEAYGVDVMIVGRGGGSMEDLWGFNSELVAEAIFNCSIPIISAVGHEVDYTIADYVADLRAPTPSAAAELAVYEYDALMSSMADYRDRLNLGMKHCVEHARFQVEKRMVRLKGISPENRLNDKKMRSIAIEERLRALINEKMLVARNRLGLYAERLKGLSPAEKLAQGFSHVSDSDGRTVTEASQVSAGDRITINVSRGVIEAVVDKTYEV